MNWKGIAICICIGAAMVLSFGVAGAEPTTVLAESPGVSASNPAYDEFVFAAEVTSSVSAGCTSCGIIDACLDSHPNEPCKPTDPACRCKRCNGQYECYK